MLRWLVYKRLNVFGFNILKVENIISRFRGCGDEVIEVWEKLIDNY